jgi:exopolysaccharide biosynthesis WecB/TagA/CpsF family protein
VQVAQAGAFSRATPVDVVPTVDILGIPVAQLRRSEAVTTVERLVERPEPALVAFANAHTLNVAYADARFAAVLRKADLVLNDGVGLALAARMSSQRFPENLNGSDFSPAVLDLAARRGWSVYLLGARPGVVEQAAEVLATRHPGLRIAGMHHGLFAVEEELSVVESIRQSGADICMVGMGNPLQELFLARYLRLSGVRLGIGVGAFFDFTAEVVPRAPKWANAMGVEWVYRLVQEPKRLWKRYVVGNPLFLARAAGRAQGARRSTRP